MNDKTMTITNEEAGSLIEKLDGLQVENDKLILLLKNAETDYEILAHKAGNIAEECEKAMHRVSQLEYKLAEVE